MMLRRVTLGVGDRLPDGELPRGGGLDAEVLSAAGRIVEDVRARGDQAVRELTARFDGVEIDELRVSDEEIEAALDAVPEELSDALVQAAFAIEQFHRRQVPDSWFEANEFGSFLGQKVTPIERVGIYVPGGRAVYPSSVLMNAIPALVAGVDEIALVTPPGEDGRVAPATLAAATVAGVSEIYRVGGAQAVAALAYGTDSIRAVDKIAGPGNAYVTAAKKLVSGDVGIDMLAGPSEALVLADGTAPPGFVAVDLVMQAEHDPRAAVYLVTTDPDLPDAVEEVLEELLSVAPRGEIVRECFRDNGLAVVCPDVMSAIDTANDIAPEHLSVMMVDPMELLGSIRNAGSIFLGPWSPQSIGDYIAGPNHVLPTGGTARFASPLSVLDFVKRSSVISYSREALAFDGPTAMTLAEAEGLDAHALAIALRLEGLAGMEDL
jgi:histidinol dehydrogenase